MTGSSLAEPVIPGIVPWGNGSPSAVPAVQAFIIYLKWQNYPDRGQISSCQSLEREQEERVGVILKGEQREDLYGT